MFTRGAAGTGSPNGGGRFSLFMRCSTCSHVWMVAMTKVHLRRDIAYLGVELWYAGEGIGDVVKDGGVEGRVIVTQG